MRKEMIGLEHGLLRDFLLQPVFSSSAGIFWRYVPSLDFNITEEYFGSSIEEHTNTFYSSVCSFLVSRGDQLFYRICLICYSSMDITESIKTRIQSVVSGSHRVQILDLYGLPKDFVIPCVVFSFKTLVTLKLDYITVGDISIVDLPLLKILHLKNLIFPIEIGLLQFLSGSPNLEKLEVNNLACEAKGRFIRLPKLVRVSMDKPLLIFKEVEVLKFYDAMTVRFITFYFE
ncbi:hypothetical protein V8G54_013571 [Vigna mungo]|uniref:Uncharacterized protein n=1 Tax=Vigna mungo TaxID=3915 RepID=A0AAQ3NTL8_VIGMU